MKTFTSTISRKSSRLHQLRAGISQTSPTQKKLLTLVSSELNLHTSTRRRVASRQNQSLGIRLLELAGDVVDLLLRGRLLVLHQLLIPGRHAPVVRLGERRPVRPSGGSIELGPVLLIRPGPHPRLGMQHQACAPQIVFVVRGGKLATLFSKLLGDGSHVVRLDLAAASDVADAHVVGPPGVPVHVPAGDDAGLQS